MQNHHGGVVLVNGYLYGFNNSILTCLEFATGKMMWRDRSVGKGTVAYADGHLYLLGENNVVGLAEATPAGYKEKGRFRIADQGLPSWAHPVVSGGRLYVRDQGTLAAYNIKARDNARRRNESEFFFVFLRVVEPSWSRGPALRREAEGRDVFRSRT